ncbi:10978_t:CDS:1, partial [Acaulospora morrowiae]
MSVERLWNITWNSICTTAKRHVKKANPKKISTHRKKNHSQLHNPNRNIGSVYNLGKLVHLANTYIKRKRKSNTMVKKINKITKSLQKQNIPITNFPFQESANPKTKWLEEVKDLWQAMKKTTNHELQSNINAQIKEATQKRMEQYSKSKKKMINSILLREHKTIEMNTIVTKDPEITIITEPKEIKELAKKHFSHQP